MITLCRAALALGLLLSVASLPLGAQEKPQPSAVVKAYRVAKAEAQAKPESGAGQAFDPVNLDEKLRLLKAVQPVYPYNMSRANVTGNATVEFIIDTKGKVVKARAVRSTHKEFESAAIESVLQWKFKPGKKNGQPVNVRAMQQIDFNIN